MSVATTTSKIQYTLTTGAQALSVPFYFLDNTHIKAVTVATETVPSITLVLGTDYTLTGAGNPGGGTLTTIATVGNGLTTGSKVVIKRNLPITQPTSYSPNDAFPAKVHEAALDRGIMIAQQSDEQSDRAIRFPEDDSATSELPSAVERAGKACVFDDDGNVEVVERSQALFTSGDAINFPSVSALKAYSYANVSDKYPLNLGGYYATGDGGGGPLYVDKADTTTADNGVTVFVSADGTRLKRIDHNTINIKQAGAKCDGNADDTARIQAALSVLVPYSILEFMGICKVSSMLTVTTNNVIIEGSAKIIASASSTHEYIIYGTGLTGVTIRGIEFDANQVARAGTQVNRFMGVYFASSADIILDNIKVSNTLGYSGVSAVGISIGQGIRCKILGCNLVDCGTNTLTSDAIYTSGTQNEISNCTAKNCTDTAFVIEDSDYSIISECTAIDCASLAAITVSLTTNRYGNTISGLTCKNWDAPSTGGVQIGTLSSTGNLFDTNVTGITMYSNIGGGYGSGAAIWLRRVGSGNIIGLNANNIIVDGADYAIRVDDGVDIMLSNVTAKNIASSAFLFIAGGIHMAKDCYVNGAAVGFDSQNSSSVHCVSCTSAATTSAAFQALGTSIMVIKDINIIGILSGSRTAKDSGATLNFGSVVNNLKINNASTLTVDFNVSSIIQTTTASTYTLPAPSSCFGMEIKIKTEFAGAVISNSSNVVPLIGGSPSTAILSATPGKWATIKSDGNYWYIIASN